MASIYLNPKGPDERRWVAQIRIKSIKALTKYFPTRDEAWIWAGPKEEELRSQIRMRRVPNAKGFNEEKLRAALLMFQQDESKLRKGEKHRITAILKFVGEEEKMEEIDEDFAMRYAESVLAATSNHKRPYTASTVSTHFSTLSRLYKSRQKHYRLTPKKSPFSNSLLPDSRLDSRDRRLHEDEQRAIAKVIREHHAKKWWRLLLRLALETGARQMELAEAPWREFDLKLRVWNLPKRRTKAKKNRMIPLSRRAMRLMRCLLNLRTEGAQMVFPGLPVNVSGAFARIVKNAGVDDFRFHDLRHEAISRMVARKRLLSVYEIMKIVGHNTLQMLERYHNMRPQDIVERME